MLFPLGRAGCVDVRSALAGAPSHRRINKLRERRAIVDIGHLDGAALKKCGADVLILSNYARYRAEAARFPQEAANYRRLVAGYTRRAIFGRAGEEGERQVEVFTRDPVR